MNPLVSLRCPRARPLALKSVDLGLDLGESLCMVSGLSSSQFPPSVSYPEKNSRLTVWHGLLPSPVSKCLLSSEDRSSPPPSSPSWAGWHEVLNTCTWHLQGIQISCRIVTESCEGVSPRELWESCPVFLRPVTWNHFCRT